MNPYAFKKKQLSMSKTRLSVPAFLLKTYEMIEVFNNFLKRYTLLSVYFL